MILSAALSVAWLVSFSMLSLILYAILNRCKNSISFSKFLNLVQKSLFFVGYASKKKPNEELSLNEAEAPPESCAPKKSPSHNGHVLP